MGSKFMNSTVIQEDMEYILQYNPDKWKVLYNKTILVTGATGMLASYLVYFFIYLNEFDDANIKIIAQIRSSDKCEKRFGEFANKNYFIAQKIDIIKKIDINIKVDYIIHAASLASPQYYETMPIEVSLPNVVGTYNLLELATINNVEGMLFFSSGDVYGRMPDNTGDITEDMVGLLDPIDKHSCYGESKRMGENLCVSYARERNIPVNMVRIAHTYGPTMDVDNDPRVFASFMKCVYEGRDIVLLSDGQAKRPFCYVADAVVAFLLILLSGQSGQAYNMSNSDNFISIYELAEVIAKLRADKNLSVVRKQRENLEHYLENTSNKANKLVSYKLAELGWKHNFDVASGFLRVLRHLQEVNTRGLKEL